VIENAAGTELAVVPCQVVAACGGCPLMPSQRQRELEAKQVSVSRALARAELAHPELEWAGVFGRFGYRNRLRLRVTADGQVAFFNPHKVAECAVLEPSLAALMEQIREYARRQPDVMRSFAHLEARALDLDGRGGVCLQPLAGSSPADSARALQHGVGDTITVTVAGMATPARVPSQRWAVSDDVYARVPLDAFLQVNTLVNRALVAAVRELARERGVQRFVDLYAGSGNLGLPLLRDGKIGVCVEVQPSALPALDRACLEQDLPRPSLRAESAEHAARALFEAGERFDLVILDAPRAGVKTGIEHMAALTRRSLAVCSCNPESLARNLRSLTALGFVLERLLLFDMFPNTRHVEVLAWLERR
jgi:23S rRNA (uracil1939-C5)-methyltransferase